METMINVMDVKNGLRELCPIVLGWMNLRSTWLPNKYKRQEWR